MRARRTNASSEELLSPVSEIWTADEAEVALSPVPLEMVRELSPLMAQRTDHGAVRSVLVGAAHNGSELALRLEWQTPSSNTIDDLDSFADAAAILFPMHPEAQAVTMGSAGRPVNAWYWRAGGTCFDVLAEGLGSSVRRDSQTTSLRSRSTYADGRWLVTLVRALATEGEAAQFAVGTTTGIAFSVWDGGNAERAAHKSASMAFSEFEIAT